MIANGKADGEKKEPAAQNCPEIRDFMKEEGGEKDGPDGFERCHGGNGPGGKARQAPDEEGVGNPGAADAEKKKLADFRRRWKRWQGRVSKGEKETDETGNQKLAKGPAVCVFPGIPVDEGEYREAGSRKKSPEETRLEVSGDLHSGEEGHAEKDACSSKKLACLRSSFVYDRFEQEGEKGEGREGQNPDGHRRFLDGGKKRVPVEGEETSREKASSPSGTASY